MFRSQLTRQAAAGWRSGALRLYTRGKELHLDQGITAKYEDEASSLSCYCGLRREGKFVLGLHANARFRCSRAVMIHAHAVPISSGTHSWHT